MSLPSTALSRRSFGSSSHVTYSPLSSPNVQRRKLPQLAGKLLPHKKRVFPIDNETERSPSPVVSDIGKEGSAEQPRGYPPKDKRIRELFTASEIRCHSAPNSPRVSYCSGGAKPRVYPQQMQESRASHAECAASRHRNPSVCSSGSTAMYQMRRQQQIIQCQQLQPPPPPYPGSCSSLLVGCAAGSRHSLISCQSAASAATYACHVQEIRELSLGRHKTEPFGMKVEALGDSFFITHVVTGSAAANAGLKTGDEIVGINGYKLQGMRTREVLQLIRRCEVSVRLSYRPRAMVARIREVRLMKDNGVVGLRLQKKSDGLYIDFVKLGTPAHAAGLKEGDQVLKVNGHFVTEWSMEGAMALLKSLNEQLVLLVRETMPLAQVPVAEPRRVPRSSTLLAPPGPGSRGGRHTLDGCASLDTVGGCGTGLASRPESVTSASGLTWVLQQPQSLPPTIPGGSVA